MISTPIRFDDEFLPEPERSLLAHLDARHFVPPVDEISTSLARPRPEIVEQLRRLCDSGFLNRREVPEAL